MYNFTKDSTPQDFVEELREVIKDQMIPACDTREYLEVALSLRKLLDRWCEAKGIKG